MRVVPVNSEITYRFGVKDSNYRLGYHPGTDYGCPAGTMAAACEAGIINWVGNLGDGYGNQAKLHLDSGGVLVYCHLLDNGLLVSSGTHVEQGQTIAITGSTGFVTGPHLHIEWRPDDNVNNPQDFELWLKGGSFMVSESAYKTGAEAVGTEIGPDFSYPSDKSSDEFADFLLSQAPRITPEMEKHWADVITGIPNVVGAGYNSAFVGKLVSTDLPKLIDFWGNQPKAQPAPMISDITPPPKPLPNLTPLPIPLPSDPTPANQEKVNIFVALWKAIFG